MRLPSHIFLRYYLMVRSQDIKVDRRGRRRVFLFFFFLSFSLSLSRSPPRSWWRNTGYAKNRQSNIKSERPAFLRLLPRTFLRKIAQVVFSQYEEDNDDKVCKEAIVVTLRYVLRVNSRPGLIWAVCSRVSTPFRYYCYNALHAIFDHTGKTSRDSRYAN